MKSDFLDFMFTPNFESGEGGINFSGIGLPLLFHLTILILNIDISYTNYRKINI